MAVDLQEKESWVASQFLKGEDAEFEKQDANRKGSGSESLFCGFESCGSSSFGAMSTTPGGSELDSTETESDEDDFIDELTRLMADYMLQEDEENTTPNFNSGNSESGKLSDHHAQMHMSVSAKPTPIIDHNHTGFYSNQAAQFYDHARTPQMKCWGRTEKMGVSTQQVFDYCKGPHHMQNRGRSGNQFVNGGNGRNHPLGSSHVGNGSGMRAIFLDGSRSGSCGTGVFLPRGTNDNAPVSRKKPGCSTVLIPTRVLQTLKDHFNSMDVRSQSNGFNGYLNHNYDDNNNIAVGEGDVHTQQKRPYRPSHTQPAVNHHHHHLRDIQLPQEWTY